MFYILEFGKLMMIPFSETMSLCLFVSGVVQREEISSAPGRMGAHKSLPDRHGRPANAKLVTRQVTRYEWKVGDEDTGLFSDVDWSLGSAGLCS